MEASKSPPGSVRRAGRNISTPMIRRSTKGPLDLGDDPLAAPATSPLAISPSELATPTEAAETQHSLPEPALPQQTKAKVDVRFLQDPSVYHQLPTDDVAPTFLNSENQPSSETALPHLIQHGHFRRAAEAALSQLRQRDHNDAEQILQLLYTRLACLVLISRPDLASQEAIPLTELLARNPPGAKDVLPLIPWELRLLLVRLQSIGAADGGRRGIMALYALASEVRAHMKEAQDEGSEAEFEVWAGRLRELGLRVADSLVEMGELETAGRHLGTLTDVDGDEVAARRTLLRVRVGDVAGAQRSLDKLHDQQRKAMLDALLQVADGKLADATHAWRQLAEEDSGNALFAQNLAVCLLYTGHIADARAVLEDVSNHLSAFPTLLFNLSTVYELCTERAVERKTGLMNHIAAKAPASDSGGWERANFEFKL